MNANTDENAIANANANANAKANENTNANRNKNAHPKRISPHCELEPAITRSKRGRSGKELIWHKWLE